MLTRQVISVYDDHPYRLLVADYTTNTQLLNYKYAERKNDWQGPFGKYVFKVECWKEAADQASSCRIGGFYRIKNVRAKLYCRLLPQLM